VRLGGHLLIIRIPIFPLNTDHFIIQAMPIGIGNHQVAGTTKANTLRAF
jgi:hypothetical protein